MGAALKASLSRSNALWALELQDRDLGLLMSNEVRGAVSMLKFLINRR